MSGSWRRWGAALVVCLLAVGWVVGCVLLAQRLVVTWRVDTQVAAVVEERGCVASFLDPAGRRREVDLLGIRGGCSAGDPGDRVTVWYASEDPGVNAPTDNWWIYAVLILSVPAVLGAVAVAGRGREVRPAGAAAVPRSRADAVGIIRRERDAHLVHDYATGRLEVLLGERLLGYERNIFG